MSRVVLQIENLVHCYGQETILDHVSLKVEEGQIACLLGASGCGKTTLLRCIAGFETVVTGTITINGSLVSCKGHHLPPEERKIGLVFQDYALFPHLTVRENVGFGIRHLNRHIADKKINGLLESVDMQKFGSRYPTELSGGQQQRVALARALAPEPDLLLLDEPFSNLDSNLREKMKYELKALLSHFGVTAILVTHNQDEAFDIADKIAVMERGKLLQWGDSYTLYHQPANKSVAQFLGVGMFLPAKITPEGSLETEIGTISSNVGLKDLLGQDISVLLRPDDVVHDDSSNTLARLERIAFRGMYQIYYLSLPSGSLIYCFTSSHHLEHKIGDSIGIRLDLKHIVIFNGRQAILKNISYLDA